MKPKLNRAVTDYWLKNYCNGQCTLCGNTGRVDTRETAITPTGMKVGRRDYCICPNGQTIRAAECVSTSTP